MLSKFDWVTLPPVTAIMVFDRPQQFTAARASVENFFAQNWPYKELIVYNTTQHSLFPVWREWLANFPLCSARRSLELRLRPLPLPDILKLCVANSNGEWCLIWLPDCWYHPDYIKFHMEHRDKQRLVTLRRKQVFALADRTLATVLDDTIPCWSFYRHVPVNFAEPLPNQFTGVVTLDNPAGLLIKFARELV